MIDLLYVSHNRLEFTKASFAALVQNTDWDLVHTLHVYDDDSRDGTSEYLLETLRQIEVDVHVHVPRASLGGPVAAMNLYLDQGTGRSFAKIDNDVIVCPGWLETMLDVFTRHDEIDALGMEPRFGDPVQPINGKPRDWKSARWIGGVGLFRYEAFSRRRPVPVDRWFGLTSFLRHHVTCAWITPDLPVFLLDWLPFEPWQSLRREYVRQGWQRDWDYEVYPAEMAPYWQWWLKSNS